MQIFLTANEVLYLDDSVTLESSGIPVSSLRGTTSEQKIAVPVALLLKISSCVAEALKEEPGKMYLNLSLQEAFLLREVSQSSVVYGKEPVGLSLKKKLHEVILAFCDEKKNTIDIGEDPKFFKEVYDGGNDNHNSDQDEA